MTSSFNPDIAAISYEEPAHKQVLLAYSHLVTAKEQLLSVWNELLDTTQEESEVQQFLERHPYMLPGLHDYHNGPRCGVVVSQLPLGPDYRVDFAFVTVNSMMMQFTLIEIESPAKKIFNADSTFSQAFNKAYQQVLDWKRWAEDNKNELLQMFAELFRGYNVQNDYKSVKCYLVCQQFSL